MGSLTKKSFHKQREVEGKKKERFIKSIRRLQQRKAEVHYIAGKEIK